MMDEAPSTKASMTRTDPHFEALKSITRVQWLLNFEALGAIGNDEDALDWRDRAPAVRQ